MSNKERIMQEIEKIPENFLEEALNYILLLKTKSISERTETLRASESSLKKDWLSPEEDVAWQNL